MNRYSRQILFQSIGEKGQQKLSQKHVLIIGAGALGTGNAEALVRAGVGKITIIDRDYVEWSNLQRQQLYGEYDALHRIPKAVAAKERFKQINSEIDIEAHILDATAQELLHFGKNVDLIIDATDNFDTRMMINDVSQTYKIPWIYGACVGSYGISFTIIPGVTPCLHCLMKHIPIGGLTCDTAGIISPAVSMVVSYQTAEGLKILVEDWDALRKEVVSFDLWKNEFSRLDLSKLKNDNCTSCGNQPTFPYLQYENQMKVAVLCGRDSVQIRPPSPQKLDLVEVARTLEGNGGKVNQNPYLISFSIGNKRMVLFQDGRALIHGTKDINEAKSFYHRYLG